MVQILMITQAFPPIMLSMSTINCGGTGLRNPRKTSLKLLSSLASRKSQTRLSYHGYGIAKKPKHSEQDVSPMPMYGTHHRQDVESRSSDQPWY